MNSWVWTGALVAVIAAIYGATYDHGSWQYSSHLVVVIAAATISSIWWKDRS